MPPEQQLPDPLDDELKSISEKFEFKLSECPVGVPIVRDFEVSAGMEEAYLQFPPAVLEQAELYWVTGMGTDYTHMRMLIRHTMGIDVPEPIMRHHFAKHFERLHAERRDFLQRRHERALEEQLEICTNPVDGRFQAIALGMSTILEAMVNNVLQGKRTVNVKELRDLAAAATEIAHADPSYMRKARNDAASHARRVEAEKVVGMGEGFVRARKYMRDSEGADDLVDRFRKHTDRILREGNGEDDLEVPDGT